MTNEQIKYGFTEKLKNAIFAFLVFITVSGIVWYLFPSHYSAASISSTINSLENEIGNIDAKIKKYTGNIKKAEQTIESQRAYKAELDETLALLTEKIEKTNELITSYDNAIISLDGNITNKEYEIDCLYEEFKIWICLIQEYGDIGYLQMLISSESFKEFLSSSEQISDIMQYQETLMQRLESDIANLDKERSSLEIYRLAGEETRRQLQADEKEYASLASSAESYIATLESNVELWTQMKADEESNRTKLDKELEEALRKQALMNSKYVGGTFMWPVDISFKKVSSPFGPRSYPWSGNHTGIDIPASRGESIFAVNAGNVVTATWHSSYGYYVVIDHGGGIATLYAHCSRLLVSAGQTVKKGQVIAKVGSTGSSTGNHLHFEVRESGIAVNPLGGYVVQP